MHTKMFSIKISNSGKESSKKFYNLTYSNLTKWWLPFQNESQYVSKISYTEIQIMLEYKLDLTTIKNDPTRKHLVTCIERKTKFSNLIFVQKLLFDVIIMQS